MKRISTALLGLLISGCSLMPNSKLNINPDMLWQQRVKQLTALDSWHIKGRTAIRQDTESWNAGLTWNQNKSTYEIKLFGPFSQGVAALNGDKNKVTMTLEDGQVVSAPSPEKLIFDVLGIYLPVSALRSWIKGIADPRLNVDKMIYDDQGRLIQLEQDGSQIQYKRYMSYKTYSLPEKIFITSNTLSLRFIINDWNSAQ